MSQQTCASNIPFTLTVDHYHMISPLQGTTTGFESTSGPSDHRRCKQVTGSFCCSLFVAVGGADRQHTGSQRYLVVTGGTEPRLREEKPDGCGELIRVPDTGASCTSTDSKCELKCSCMMTRNTSRRPSTHVVQGPIVSHRGSSFFRKKCGDGLWYRVVLGVNSISMFGSHVQKVIR